MIYKNMGKIDEKLSVVGLGTWAFGGDYWGEIQDKDSIRTIETAIDHGINLIDTAPAYGYGHSEEIVGIGIKEKRDQVFLTTKCGTVRKGEKFFRDLRPESIRLELEQSLKRLQTDYIDLYLLHWPDVDTPIEDTIEEIIKIKESGKIRYFGVSNYDKETMMKIQKMIPIDCYEPHFSVLNSSKEEEMSYVKSIGAGCITYGTLAGGILTGKYKEIPKFEPLDKRSVFYPYFEEPLFSQVQEFLKELERLAEKYNQSMANIVLNYTFKDSRVTSAITGAKTPEQVLHNISSTKFHLTSEDIDLISHWRRTFNFKK